MRGHFAALIGIFSFFAIPVLMGSTAKADSPQQPKDWTILVYLNGNNNLDPFGTTNIEQMEKVGSTDRMNIVVQWASLANGKTQRLLIQKSSNPNAVTSPVVEDMGTVDMGDYHSLTEFIRWGAAKYPARHYMVDIWDHGSGWHRLNRAMTREERSRHLLQPMDISWDQNTNHWITTPQLGEALREAAGAIGRKIDVVGTDACLMAMVEVGQEISDSTSYLAASQEVEPGPGWPYDAWLAHVQAAGTVSPATMATILTDEYVKSYSGGENGDEDVTFSTQDLSRLPALDQAVKAFGATLQKLDANGIKQMTDTVGKTQSFTYDDYGDLQDFLSNLRSTRIPGIDARDIDGVQQAASAVVIDNRDTQAYAKATGMSIWLPRSQDEFTAHASDYQQIEFDQITNWGGALQYLFQNAPTASRSAS